MKTFIFFALFLLLSLFSNAQTFTMHDFANTGINIYSATGFVERSDSTLFIGQGNNGVIEYNFAAGTWTHHRNSAGVNYWLGNNVSYVKIGSGDTLYAANSKRISVYDGTSWVAPPSGLIYGGPIDVDNKGALWALNGGSVPEFQRYYKGNLQTWTDADFPVLKDMFEDRILALSENSVYISAETGLYHYDGDTITQIAFDGEDVEEIFIDADGDLWVTVDYGFAEFKNGNWERYNTTTKPNWPGNFGRNGSITQISTGQMFVTGGYYLSIIDLLGNATAYSYHDTTTQMPSTANYFPHLYTDSRDHVWMAIYQGGGIIEIDPSGIPNNPPTGVLQEVPLKSFSINPNPAFSSISIHTDLFNQKRTISIFDLSGKQVFFSNTNLNNIDISNYSKGTYIVKIEDENSIGFEKFIVQ